MKELKNTASAQPWFKTTNPWRKILDFITILKSRRVLTGGGRVVMADMNEKVGASSLEKLREEFGKDRVMFVKVHLGKLKLKLFICLLSDVNFKT